MSLVKKFCRFISFLLQFQQDFGMVLADFHLDGGGKGSDAGTPI